MALPIDSQADPGHCHEQLPSKLQIGRGLRSPFWALSSSILCVAALLCLLWYFGVQDQLLRLLQWTDGLGVGAALLFVAIMAAAVVLLIPGLFLTTGAGFAFGVLEGSVYVVVGTVLGAAVAFLIARHLLGQPARRVIGSHTPLGFVVDEMARDGWKVVLLTRLIPFFPSKLANYFFGLTPVSFRGFTAGSFLGFIPYSVHNVYLGSIAADITTLTERDIGRSWAEWAVYGAGFAVTVGIVLYFSWLARRALNRYAELHETAEPTA